MKRRRKRKWNRQANDKLQQKQQNVEHTSNDGASGSNRSIDNVRGGDKKEILEKSSQLPKMKNSSEAEPTKLRDGPLTSSSLAQLPYSWNDNSKNIEEGLLQIQKEAWKMRAIVNKIIEINRPTLLCVPEDVRPFVLTMLRSTAMDKAQFEVTMSSRLNKYIAELTILKCDMKRLEHAYDVARAKLHARLLIESAISNVSPPFIHYSNYSPFVQREVMFEFCLTKEAKALMNRFKVFDATFTGKKLSEAVEKVFRVLPEIKSGTEYPYEIKKEVWEEILIDLGISDIDTIIQIVTEMTKTIEKDELGECIEKPGDRYIICAYDFVADTENRSDARTVMELKQIFHKYAENIGRVYYVKECFDKTKDQKNAPAVFAELFDINFQQETDMLEIAKEANANVRIYKTSFNPA